MVMTPTWFFPNPNDPLLNQCSNSFLSDHTATIDYFDFMAFFADFPTI